MENLQYAYLIGDILLGMLWLGFLLIRRDLFKEMILVGTIMGVIAVIVAPLFYDYWKPIYIHSWAIEEFFLVSLPQESRVSYMKCYLENIFQNVLIDAIIGRLFVFRRDCFLH